MRVPVSRIPGVLAAVSAALASIPSAEAQGPGGEQPQALARLTGPIRVDGIVDEPSWHAIPPLPLAQFLPDPGGPVREASTIRVAYDEAFFYASGVFAVRDVRNIRANSLLRDVYAEDDYMNLIIDTFDDRESAVWFLVTPHGTRIDGAIANDAEGTETQWNRPEYDMAWDAAAKRTPEGWSVEIRIPLSTLRFQARDGRVTMGLIASRLISNGKERYIFPAIRPTRALAHFKPSLSARVTLENVAASRLRTLAPYALLGRESLPPASPGEPGVLERRGVHNVGADLKLGLSSRLTLDLTANTDFAQAESDEQQVNLSRFSLFFPEKRQFFLERSSVFDFATGGNDRLFYSRRIGLGLDGRPLRVFGGARLVGRVGGWDVGALDLVTHAEQGGEDNALVVRVRRSLDALGSYVGGIVTSLGSAPFSGDRAAGVDGTLRVRGDNYLLWSAAATAGPDMTAPLKERSVFRAAWERRRRTGLHLGTAFSRVGSGYAPTLGFVQRPGMASLEQLTRWGWIRDRGRFREQSIGLTTTIIRGLTTKTVETAVFEPAWSGTTAKASQARVFVRVHREVLADTLRLSGDAVAAPGTFTFGEVGVGLASPPGALARVRLDVQGGGFYNGHRLSTTLSAAWNPSPHLELSGDAEGNRVWHANGVFRGDVVRMRSRLAFDAKTSVTGSVQYNRATGALATSVRFRRSWREGTDLFVVFNDVRGDAERNALGLPSTLQAQYVAVKYVHTLR